MMCGQSISEGNFVTVFADENKDASIYIRLLEIASIELSGNPIRR